MRSSLWSLPLLLSPRAGGFDSFFTEPSGASFVAISRARRGDKERLAGVVRKALGEKRAEMASRQDGPSAGRPEEKLLGEISKMIGALVNELERAANNRSSPFFLPRESEGEAGGDSPGQSNIPIHFRVYRSQAGGMPGGGGLPMLPGGLGGMGGEPDEESEATLLERRLNNAGLPKEVDEVAQRELKRLRRMSPMNSEYSTIVDYLEWFSDLPWNRSSDETLSIKEARQQLEDDHAGLEKVKTRILEYLAVGKLKGDMRGSILCLMGPPGIGKTSLGKSVADALHRGFYRVSLGGVHSEAEVRGHRRTYVGALPGLIIQAVKKCGTNNCVIMLDEIDKLGRNSFNGDPSSALLEPLPLAVADPEQNQAFRDHFLNVPFDLSRIMFIATANDIETIPRPLRDRME
ncbi:MAG: hypothetical protein SGPRY_007567, partial [Prymnesium sp.]